MNTSTRRLLTTIVLAVSAAACAAESNNPPVVTMTSTTAAVAPEDAVHALARARCDRAAECNNFVNGRYKNKEECMAGVSDRVRAEYGTEGCLPGVSKAQLDKCVASLHWEECNNPMGPVGSYDECQPRKLCPPTY